ncbi:hypothetical protein SAMN05216486_1182 [bacterium JGI 053]|nr:hypothetical protein SAMN05216486_1182 [bacterium JGI 053]
MRTIHDGEGRSWRVWHVVPQSQVLRSAAPGMMEGWLCFESEGDKRRLVSPRVDWDRVHDAELVEMLGRATTVRVRVS